MRKIIRDASESDRHDQAPALNGKSKQLKPNEKDQILWCVEASVGMHEDPDSAFAPDPGLVSVLDFLEADIESRPLDLRVFEQALYGRVEALVSDIDVDLGKPLSAEDD
ncbi:type II toxin-antitoxin system PrlF family antitoxin [Thioclava sp. 15-R06ZXC-3]|uniref:Type II toxin-antitoxin system PrlF family antitoxin n=1 Tax=Thioclava arctica TaxID=3238301 RepID=A0ABV3TNJ6_9RHOB